MEAAIRVLLDAQNEDGGWGFVKGKHSNTESTAFALMALKSLGEMKFNPALEVGLNWLLKRQKDDGSWSLNDGSQESSWTTSIAGLALLSFQGQRDRSLSAVKWLLQREGKKPGWISVLWRLSRSYGTRELDPDLTGWSWTPDAFSWVEPTSYGLIAIKMLKAHLTGTNVQERIQQGEMLIYNRMCEKGGWNYGNSRVLGGAPLWPYPDVTALALIALQDHAKSRANQVSLQALDIMMREAISGMALGWGIICLEVYGRDVRQLKRILARNFQKTGFLGEIKPVALSVLVFGDGVKVFCI